MFKYNCVNTVWHLNILNLFSRIYLSNNQAFAAAAIQEGVTDDFEENWIELTKILNATLGPKKSAEEWKLVSKYFI